MLHKLNSPTEMIGLFMMMAQSIHSSLRCEQVLYHSYAFFFYMSHIF